MAAVYPSQYRSFTVHKNLLDDVDASHVNGLQDEVAAVQQTLGINPHMAKSLTMATNTWPSVGARMDAIQRGKGMPVLFLQKNSDSYRATTGSTLKKISWPAPSSGLDPEHLFNGHSIRTNRTGWWLVVARAKWGPAGNLGGPDREINIMLDDEEVSSQDLPPIGDGYSHMHITYQGWVSAGRVINLGVYHSLINTTLSLQNLHLSASMLREL